MKVNKIGFDVMGGDDAPKSALEGVLEVLPSLPQNTVLVLLGDENVINPFLAAHNLIDNPQIKVVHCSQVVEMGEHPTVVLKTKQDSSIIKGLGMLKQGMLDIFLSAGNTGAIYAGSLFTVRAVEGISRPALLSLVPKLDGSTGLILDVGANADCKPEVLAQFGLLGAIYAKEVLKIENPKVGLLNIGSEPEKGNLATQGAYQMLNDNPAINFSGNIEGYDFFSSKADVLVADGFTGNVILKTAEAIFTIVKQKGVKDPYFDQFDYEQIGASPILGLNAPVMIGHGNSTPKAYKNMIMNGLKIVESGVTEMIKLAVTPEVKVNE